MRVHDRMPVILATDAARRWLEPGPLPAELLVPYPAEPMTAWRVSNDAKNSRIDPHAGMAEPVPDDIFCIGPPATPLAGAARSRHRLRRPRAKRTSSSTTPCPAPG
jgi:hypothetical protein